MEISTTRKSQYDESLRSKIRRWDKGAVDVKGIMSFKRKSPYDESLRSKMVRWGKGPIGINGFMSESTKIRKTYLIENTGILERKLKCHRKDKGEIVSDYIPIHQECMEMIMLQLTDIEIISLMLTSKCMWTYQTFASNNYWKLRSFQIMGRSSEVITDRWKDICKFMNRERESINCDINKYDEDFLLTIFDIVFEVSVENFPDGGRELDVITLCNNIKEHGSVELMIKLCQVFLHDNYTLGEYLYIKTDRSGEFIAHAIKHQSLELLKLIVPIKVIGKTNYMCIMDYAVKHQCVDICKYLIENTSFNVTEQKYILNALSDNPMFRNVICLMLALNRINMRKCNKLAEYLIRVEDLDLLAKFIDIAAITDPVYIKDLKDDKLLRKILINNEGLSEEMVCMYLDANDTANADRVMDIDSPYNYSVSTLMYAVTICPQSRISEAVEEQCFADARGIAISLGLSYYAKLVSYFH